MWLDRVFGRECNAPGHYGHTSTVFCRPREFDRVRCALPCSTPCSIAAKRESVESDSVRRSDVLHSVDLEVRLTESDTPTCPFAAMLWSAVSDPVRRTDVL